jgi:hypothetical protein
MDEVCPDGLLLLCDDEDVPDGDGIWCSDGVPGWRGALVLVEMLRKVRKRLAV